MTLRRALLAALALLVIALVVWKLGRGPSDTPSASVPSATQSAIANRQSEIKTPAAERSTLADTLNSPATDIRADLRIVADVVEAFRSNFPQTGNPVGSNEEITAALTGKNKLRLALIPKDHPAISKAGELCDRWGTPFFFHAESATRMEIRSAGPDKKMWNDDDVVLSP